MFFFIASVGFECQAIAFLFWITLEAIEAEENKASDRCYWLVQHSEKKV